MQSCTLQLWLRNETRLCLVPKGSSFAVSPGGKDGRFFLFPCCYMMEKPVGMFLWRSNIDLDIFIYFLQQNTGYQIISTLAIAENKTTETVLVISHKFRGILGCSSMQNMLSNIVFLFGGFLHPTAFLVFNNREGQNVDFYVVYHLVEATFRQAGL